VATPQKYATQLPSTNAIKTLKQYIVKKMETLPVELLTRIFENCDDFPQVVAFASVCKQTYAAWVTNPGRIIWNVATSQIRSFDDALMAVNINSK
jgi:hypothetical protein